jgi:uncharacterized protein YciI
MNQWLFVVIPTRPEMLSAGLTPEERSSVGRHLAYWEALVADGTAFLVGRTQTKTPDTMGLAIFHAADEAAAKTIAEADPAVQDGVFSMRLHPYAIALLGDPTDFRPDPD